MAGLVAVDLRDLRYRYPSGVEALRGVNLRVAAGEKVCLLGPNGAGKSTLLLHLNGLLRGRGQVEVLGTPVAPPHLDGLRRRVGLLFENPEDQLFLPTVADEVALAALNARLPREEVRRRVERALARLGLAGLERREPHELSLGQKKRVAIASLLVTDCELLALDEPTGGLDPWGRAELLELLAGLPVTQVIATHDLRVAQRLAARCVLLREGQVAAEGSAQEAAAWLPG